MFHKPESTRAAKIALTTLTWLFRIEVSTRYIEIKHL